MRITRRSDALNSVSVSFPFYWPTDLENTTIQDTETTAELTQEIVHNYKTQYSPSIYNENYISEYASPINSNRFIQPDIKFRKLPFFITIADVLKPSILICQTNEGLQESRFHFYLTPQQATDIACSRDIRPGVKNYVKQIQMRFCPLETTCEQEDYFPPIISVKVNNKLVKLPNFIARNKPELEPERLPLPVNITSLVKLSPTVANTISISWEAEFSRTYAISISLVHQLTPQDLLMRLKTKCTKHTDYTRGMIKEKLKDASEMAKTSLKVSLMCPLGKMRIRTPCRPTTCSHIQCFDALFFLQINESNPRWICPVCDKPALYENLVIDGYFQDVLRSKNLLGNINEIQLHKDGSWSIQINEKKFHDKSADIEVYKKQ